ncbi:MAG: DUF924 domain-containing protein [Coxiellaceae bacterium]|nr:DUF924 domain-containing protein [Coxiellaceae bacterium]
MNTALINEIITFWLGDVSTEQPLPNEAITSQWWRKDAAFDQQIRMRFEGHIKKAEQGGYIEWLATPRGCLAYVLLLDQFSRNIYRGTAQAFIYDPLALAAAEFCVDAELDQELLPVERAFVYMPFEHSELLENQQRSVELFEALAQSVEPESRALFAGFVNYAMAHLRVIEQFNRFPHRNEIIDRPSTVEEIEYLAQPNSGF